MSHPNEETLNDYVDALLDPSDRVDLERHLDGCSDCKQTIAELQSLVSAAAELGDVEPGRDLLPRIRSATRKPESARFRWVAAAAVMGFVALLAVLQLRNGETAPPTAGAQPQASIETLLADFRAAEAEYIRATETLAVGIEARRDEFDPETLAVLETNLALIDAAIVEVRFALDRDGVGFENSHALTALYNKKLDVLLRASRLSS